MGRNGMFTANWRFRFFCKIHFRNYSRTTIENFRSKFAQESTYIQEFLDPTRKESTAFKNFILSLAPLHYCTTALLHYCTTALLHYLERTALLHYCTTGLLLHYLILSLALLHYCTTALLHYCTTALLGVHCSFYT